MARYSLFLQRCDKTGIILRWAGITPVEQEYPGSYWFYLGLSSDINRYFPLFSPFWSEKDGINLPVTPCFTAVSQHSVTFCTFSTILPFLTFLAGISSSLPDYRHLWAENSWGCGRITENNGQKEVLNQGITLHFSQTWRKRELFTVGTVLDSSWQFWEI